MPVQPDKLYNIETLKKMLCRDACWFFSKYKLAHQLLDAIRENEKLRTSLTKQLKWSEKSLSYWYSDFYCEEDEDKEYLATWEKDNVEALVLLNPNKDSDHIVDISKMVDASNKQSVGNQIVTPQEAIEHVTKVIRDNWPFESTKT